MLQQIWAKFNANEKLASYGAGLVILAYILGIALSGGIFGFGGGFIGPLGAIALLVVYYLKYTNTTIQWPAPIPVIAFGIGAIIGIIGLLALLSILQVMGVLAAYGGATWLLAPILSIVGALVMAWGTYKEWQATKTTTA